MLRILPALLCLFLFVPLAALPGESSAEPELEVAVRAALPAGLNPEPAAIAEASGTTGPVVLKTEVVAQLTGPGSANATDARWNVHGTDLGHMFWHRDELYMVFGDTYGPDGSDWRSNVIARIADPDPLSGFPFASMIADATGAAREIVESRKLPGLEWTVIPTQGISVGGRMALHYMAVLMWGPDDEWYVGRSGLAYSDDDGQTWVKSDTAVWPGGSGFEQVAYTERDGMIYVFGIPQGRHGAARLGRVTADGFFNPAAYEYWDGQNWSKDIAAAAAVVPGPVGELSVVWSGTHERWLMMYFDPFEKAVVLRSSPELTGPWSATQKVASADDFPGLYAPYFVPGVEVDGTFYFTMSRWKPLYNVFLMKGQFAPSADTLAAADTNDRVDVVVD